MVRRGADVRSAPVAEVGRLLGYGPIPVDKIGAPPRALFGEAGGGCSRFRSIRGGRIYRGARRPGGAEARNRRRRGGLIPGRCGAKYTIGRCARRGRPGGRPEPDVVGSSLPLFTVARLGTVAYSNGGEPLPPTEPLRYRRRCLFLPVRSGSNAPRKSGLSGAT